MREFDRIKPEDREKKLYFNKYEFLKIAELSKTDPFAAIEQYKAYFDKYPEDHSAKAYYISALISVGEFEEAENELNNLEIELKRNSLYHSNIDRADHLEHDIKLSKLKLLFYQGKKQEALDYFYLNFDELSDLRREVIFYFRKMRGTIDPNRRTPNSYIFRQIVEYKEEDFRDHIKKHLADFNENDRNISVSYFSPNFPVDKVIGEIKTLIPSDKKLHFRFIEDMYIFKYDQCGRDCNRIVDYFKVFTFNNTQEFITMCPSTDCENLPYVDLNYLKEKEEPKVLTKRISQIDKFNNRYKRI